MENWITEVESLYLAQAEDIFRLAFVHSCLLADAEQLMRDVLGELFTAKKAQETTRQTENALLMLMQDACMRYYEKKLRRKIKPENLRKQKLPFSISDGLLEILYLPSGLKSALVLVLGGGLSPEAAGKVLGCNANRVEAQLEKAKKRLDMPDEEIQRLLKTVAFSPADIQRLFDRVQTDAAEKSFAGKEKIKRFNRGMDRAVPIIAGVIILFIIGSYLAVRFQWFGTEELSPETQQWLAENSGLAGEGPTLAEIEAPVYVPVENGLKCYQVQNCPTDIEKLAPLMVSLGGMPEGSQLKTAVVTYTGETPPIAAPVYARSDVPTLTVVLSAEVEEISLDMLEAMARTLHAFMQEETAEVYIFIGSEELTVEGETAQSLLGRNSPVEETVEIGYR